MLYLDVLRVRMNNNLIDYILKSIFSKVHCGVCLNLFPFLLKPKCVTFYLQFQSVVGNAATWLTQNK